jgi:hypothetical protein
MALLPGVFVPEEAEDNPFAPIDQAWYEAEIIKSEMKTTNDKEGQYLALHFKILEGEKEGRLVFANLNLVNKSDVAVKIARSDLKKICAAVGHEGDLEDTVDLHNIPMMIFVTLKPATAQWPAKNEIKNYKDIDFDPDAEELIDQD